MLALFIAVLATRQNPVAMPTFASWDGKVFGGVSVGTTEKDLGKQVPKSKTVGPDPASVRIGVDKKGWILGGILTATDNKGSICGFTVDLEADQPIESLELLEGEIGRPEYAAFAPTRFSDWTLEVWASKGIAAAVTNGDRPLVMKVLLAPPATLARTLDLWQRTPNQMAFKPALQVSGFDVSASTDPKDRYLEDDMANVARRKSRRMMETGGSTGWAPTAGSGARLIVNFSTHGGNNPTMTGSVQATYAGTGAFTVSESTTENSARNTDQRAQASSIFDSIMDKLNRELEARFRKVAWQTEWRQFTSLTRPKP